MNLSRKKKHLFFSNALPSPSKSLTQHRRVSVFTVLAPAYRHFSPLSNAHCTSPPPSLQLSLSLSVSYTHRRTVGAEKKTQPKIHHIVVVIRNSGKQQNAPTRLTHNTRNS